MAEAAARARQVLGAKVDLEALVRGGRRLEREVERAVDEGRRVRKLGRREEAALCADVAEAGCLQGEVRVRVRVGLGQGFGFGFGLAAERFRVRVRVKGAERRAPSGMARLHTCRRTFRRRPPRQRWTWTGRP